MLFLFTHLKDTIITEILVLFLPLIALFSNSFRTRNRKYSVSGSPTQNIRAKPSSATLFLFTWLKDTITTEILVFLPRTIDEWQCFPQASGHEIVNTPCPAVEFSS